MPATDVTAPDPGVLPFQVLQNIEQRALMFGETWQFLLEQRNREKPVELWDLIHGVV